MAASSQSSYRDRTSEFRSVAERSRRTEQNGSEIGREMSRLFSRSEFNKKASRIGLGIHETSQKIARLAKLAKRSSMFDDPVQEIQELTALIKNDITMLNAAVSDLQTLQNLEAAEGSFSKDSFVHSTTICDDLKNKLMGTTKHFKDVLTTRTENIKAHENRKQIFSTNMSRENPFRRQTKLIEEPPPWSNGIDKSQNSTQSVSASDGVKIGNQLRFISAGDDDSELRSFRRRSSRVVQRTTSPREAKAHGKSWMKKREEKGEGANSFMCIVCVVGVEKPSSKRRSEVHPWLDEAKILRRRLATDSIPSHHTEVSMLEQVVPHQENHIQGRAIALQNVESTISELGGIFTQLASMVAQQGELAIRIDDNMDETLSNVDSARGALLQYLNRISSNRWLLIKIFAILILFILVFLFFVA